MWNPTVWQWNEDIKYRARRLFFPQLGSRTTIKHYGLVRNKNLLGHDDDTIFYNEKITNREELWSSACLLFNFRITVSETYCHMINHWCSCLEVVFISVHFDWRHRDQEYISTDIKMYENQKILIQNFERSRMQSLYPGTLQHVMSCHCCIFTKSKNIQKNHFNIFEIEWDRNIIISVMPKAHFSFKNLRRRPNDQVTAAAAHLYVSRAAALLPEIYLSNIIPFANEIEWGIQQNVSALCLRQY